MPVESARAVMVADGEVPRYIVLHRLLDIYRELERPGPAMDLRVPPPDVPTRPDVKVREFRPVGQLPNGIHVYAIRHPGKCNFRPWVAVTPIEGDDAEENERLIDAARRRDADQGDSSIMLFEHIQPTEHGRAWRLAVGVARPKVAGPSW